MKRKRKRKREWVQRRSQKGGYQKSLNLVIGGQQKSELAYRVVGANLFEHNPHNLHTYIYKFRCTYANYLNLYIYISEPINTN